MRGPERQRMTPRSPRISRQVRHCHSGRRRGVSGDEARLVEGGGSGKERTAGSREGRRGESERRRDKGLVDGMLPSRPPPLRPGSCPPPLQIPLAAAFHCLTILFLGLAVAVILREIFGKKVIGGDEVLGAFCGYMLGGIAWANIYAMIYLLVPDAFSVSSEIKWRLAAPHLTARPLRLPELCPAHGPGLRGHPAGRPSGLFAQLAPGAIRAALHGGGVAQLVGLKLAGAARSGGSGSG